MDKNEVEMEDAANELREGSEDDNESEDAVVDAEDESEAKKPPSSTVMESANSGAVTAGLTTDTILHGEQMNAKSEGHELSDNDGGAIQTGAKMEVEDQTIASAQAEGQIEAKAQLEYHPDSKSELKEAAKLVGNPDTKENLSQNGRGGGIPLRNKMADQKSSEKIEENKNPGQNGQLPFQLPVSEGQLPFQLPVSEVPPKKKEVVQDVYQSDNGGKGLEDQVHLTADETPVDDRKAPEDNSVLSTVLGGEKAVRKGTKDESDSPLGKCPQATPEHPEKYSTMRSEGPSGKTLKSAFNEVKIGETDDGTPEEQAAFMKEIESFYKEKAMEFKPPKFYGQPLNCLKLWRAVIKLGGYDRVTGTKLWRQVGESFHPPKTCTTVSWTFRIFYEKSLLEYERYQTQIGDLQLPVAALPEPLSVDNEGNGNQASGSGRARRDAAARAMEGWHAQRNLGFGEDKNISNMPKRENKLKSIGSLKQKRQNEVELPVKAQRAESSKQLATTVVDIGPLADWVKINVRETKDCFEVYALVPGLLREEVRVQSDPAGRLVITGHPEQLDNPWGITPFKKVVSLPTRIDPRQTSAVVSLHGRLYVRVPFEQPNM